MLWGGLDGTKQRCAQDVRTSSALDDEDMVSRYNSISALYLAITLFHDSLKALDAWPALIVTLIVL